MIFTELLVLSIALAMDALAVSLGTGACLQRVTLRQTFRMAWHFGLFQAFMPVIGWFAGLTFRSAIERFDHWVAFGLLAWVGISMLRESFSHDDECRSDRKDPTRGMTLVLLSVATSIDALAVGLSLSVLKVDIWWPAFVIGVTCAVFSGVGIRAGNLLGKATRMGKWAEAVGGVVLLSIGVKILSEHGVL
jgi:putative Mn2+ efflux pump MntP